MNFIQLQETDVITFINLDQIAHADLDESGTLSLYFGPNFYCQAETPIKLVEGDATLVYDAIMKSMKPHHP